MNETARLILQATLTELEIALSACRRKAERLRQDVERADTDAENVEKRVTDLRSALGLEHPA